jgi:hypothetical protein
VGAKAEQDSEVTITPPQPARNLLPRQRVEDFRRLVRGASRETLYRNVDVYLQQMDQAILCGDRHAQAWARKKWNIVWDEIDARDGIAGDLAS